MIDPHKTGAYIARLRKEHDWTQVELADRLNVTHQAVSRWETGDSFPDLITLAQLAQLFRVRMESLLDGNPTAPPAGTTRDELLTELSAGHAERAAELAKADPSDLETVIESAPLTRPSVMNEVVKNMSGYPFSPEQVTGLAPFISQELLDNMVAALTEKPDAQTLTGLAPFLSRPELNRLAGQLEAEAVDMQHLTGLAPFLDRPVLDRLAGPAVREKVEGYHVIALAPFVSRAVLDELIERLPQEQLSLEQVTGLAPFIECGRLAGMVSRFAPEQVRPHDLTALAPFLERPALQQLVQRVPPGTLDAGTIVELSPFLDRTTLEGLIRGQRSQPPTGEG